MLVLAKITRAGAGGYAEYLEGKARASELGDYYLKDGERVEAPGRWVAGADQFGIDPAGRVTGEQLRVLMDVRRPDGGGELRRAGSTGESVSAIDATFSAPKSVSAVWAVADAELRAQIEGAHERAVDRAVEYATRWVPMVRHRTGPDRVVHEKATGLVVTSWRHTTARAVDGQVPDPQIHSHVLLHAAVRQDGRLVAIDSRSWLTHQREVGAAYRTELARELGALGFSVERGTGRGGRYFEIDGVPKPLLDRWSSRHRQVQEAIKQRVTDRLQQLQAAVLAGGDAGTEAAEQLEVLSKTRLLTPAEDRLMGTITRHAKTPVTISDLDSEWRLTAHRHDISRERVEVLRHLGRDSGPLAPVNPDQVLEALTEFDATFHAREARAVALEQSAGTPIAAALEQLKTLRRDGEILLLEDGKGTTTDHRGREQAVVAITRRLSSERGAGIAPELVSREITRLDHELAGVGGRLSDEQRAAIELACGEHALVVIEGQAGTGKSTTLTGVARAHQQAGREVIVTSTAALAAERLASELNQQGVNAPSYSTAGLQAALRHSRIQLTANTTVIHDEAALASTREQLHLLRAVEQTRARLIEVGDPGQNHPVGAGGLWSKIERTIRETDTRVELTRNQRAQDPADRRDQARFRDGEIEHAIRSYAARDRLHMETNQRRAEDHALEAAHKDRANGKRTLVIAQTSNQHLDELNARTQAIRIEERELGDDSVPVPGRPYELHAGDLVQIRQTINHPDHGPLRNGTNAQIIDVDGELRTVELQLSDGNTVTLDQQQVEDAGLRLAYVQHPFPAQGHTTDTTHLITGEHSTRQATYVGLTRARERTDIYAQRSQGTEDAPDGLTALAQALDRTEPDIPSIDTPLAHEARLTAGFEREIPTDPMRDSRGERQPAANGQELKPHDPELDPEQRRWPSGAEPEAAERHLEHNRALGHEI